MEYSLAAQINDAAFALHQRAKRNRLHVSHAEIVALRDLLNDAAQQIEMDGAQDIRSQAALLESLAPQVAPVADFVVDDFNGADSTPDNPWT